MLGMERGRAAGPITFTLRRCEFRLSADWCDLEWWVGQEWRKHSHGETVPPRKLPLWQYSSQLGLAQFRCNSRPSLWMQLLSQAQCGVDFKSEWAVCPENCR